MKCIGSPDDNVGVQLLCDLIERLDVAIDAERRYSAEIRGGPLSLPLSQYCGTMDVSGSIAEACHVYMVARHGEASG